MSSGLAAGIVGSGAFSTVNADRSVSVAVADDDDAYLSLDPSSELGRAAVFDDTLSIYIPGVIESGMSPPEGEGVNQQSQYVFTDLFEITNQGDDPIEVFSKTGESPNPLERLLVVGPEGEGLDGENRSVELTPGDSKWAGILIETSTSNSPIEVEGTVVIQAEEITESN